MKQITVRKLMSILFCLMLAMGLASPVFAMQLFVQIDSGTETITLEVEPSDSIENVKSKIEDRKDIPIISQTLYYNETVLNDDKTLYEYGITSPSTLRLEVAAAHTHSGITFTACDSTTGLPTEAGNYYLTNDVSLSDSWNVPVGITNLCLNGHSISGNNTCTVIKVPSGATLNIYTESSEKLQRICDGNGNGKAGGGVYVATNGTFNMYGGSIESNVGTDYGGGVFCEGTMTLEGVTIQNNKVKNQYKCHGGGLNIGHDQEDDSGTVYATLKNCKICNNTALNREGNASDGWGGAIFVDWNCEVTITGTTIQGNSALKSGGIHLEHPDSKVIIMDSTITENKSTASLQSSDDGYGAGVNLDNNKLIDNNLKVAGDVRITGNTPGNVWLPVNTFVTVDDTLSSEAKIGVTTKTNPTANSPVVITSGLDNKGTTNLFSSDNPAYAVTLNGSNEAQLAPHTHNFTYTASGATITATCGGTGTCDITEGLTLTISAPTGSLVYDGTTTYPATLSTGYNTTAFPDTYTISYTKDGSAYDGAPKDAGAYTASVTVGTGDAAKTASVDFTIAKGKAATITEAPTAKNLTYNGSAQELVTAGKADNGTMQYALGTATEATEPYTTSIPTATEAGTYFVWYMVDADDNHIDTDPACVTVTIAAPEEGGDKPGAIQTETHADPAAYNVKAENLNQLAGTEMTDDEKKRVEQGETFLFYMEVKNIDGTVSEADKALIEQAAIEAARLAATGQESPATILQYLDFSLFKQIGTDAAQQIHQTQGDVSVTVDIPEDQQAEGRIFFIARIHDGKVEIIAQGTGKSVTCSSNLFSTYALLYVDPPKQEAAPVETMDTLLATLLSGGEDTMNLTWTTVPDATGYDVFFGKTHPKYVATVTGNSYSFTGLKKGSTYRAFVKAAGQTSPMVQCYTDKGAKPGTNPAQITLYDTELSVTVSKTARIRSTIRKPSGSKGHYSGRRFYVSSDPSIARVNRGGRVKGVSKGECNVYVMNNNGVWQRVKITVDTQPTKVAFSKARKRMKVGDTQQLNVKLTPRQAETTLTWESSDPTVATVDENGTVTATGEGRATITATAENGKTATATILVKGYAETINENLEDDDAQPLELQPIEPES